MRESIIIACLMVACWWATRACIRGLKTGVFKKEWHVAALSRDPLIYWIYAIVHMVIALLMYGALLWVVVERLQHL